MAYFKQRDLGRVYVIKLILPDDTVVHKVGMCHSDRATDRMMELLKSWFTYFRFVPYAELRLDMKCDNPRLAEKYFHKVLKPLSFTPTFKVEGSTEMFVRVDENRLLWFIKAYINSKYVEPPAITQKESEILSKLLTVDYEH
jgi:hypothetical protein